MSSADEVPLCKIDDLWPGECVLKKWCVEQWCGRLGHDEQVKPIEIAVVRGRRIVRDGNNRVRALLEHARSTGRATPGVPYLLSRQPFPPYGSVTYDVFLFGLAECHGRGARAFMAMKMSPPETYDSDGGDVERCVRDRLGI